MYQTTGDWLDHFQLNLAQHGARALLKDHFERSGRPLPNELDRLYRTYNAFAPSERAAVRSVINSDFLLAPGGYVPLQVAEDAPARRTAISASTRAAVLKRDGSQCVYCGDEDGPFEMDHVTPWSRGGADDIDNLATACVPCNRDKSDRTPEEWTGAA